MRSKLTILTFVSHLLVFGYCDEYTNELVLEERGKKKEIALFVYFADLVVKKIFILKLIYAFVFWVVLHKAGYFLHWFVSYLKEKKHHHHDEHHEHHHGHYYEYDSPHDHSPYRRKNYKH